MKFEDGIKVTSYSVTKSKSLVVQSISINNISSSKSFNVSLVLNRPVG